MNFPLLHFLGEYSYFLQCGLQITYIGITQGECGVQLLSRVQLFVNPWTPLSMEFSRQEYWNRLPFFLLQGIFSTQGSNLCLLHLLHWQGDYLLLSYMGSPLLRLVKWLLIISWTLTFLFYLVLVVLGLRCCAQAFSSCSEQASRCGGFSRCTAQAQGA